MNYRQRTLSVMNRVEMIVALYDGMIRFLHSTVASIESNDVEGRRQSIGRVLEILAYLQARLRPDLGEQPAAALSEFYAAMYAQCVRASRDASIALCEQTILDIRNVRDAWQVAAESDNSVTGQAGSRLARPEPGAGVASKRTPPPEAVATQASNCWTA